MGISGVVRDQAIPKTVNDPPVDETRAMMSRSAVAPRLSLSLYQLSVRESRAALLQGYDSGGLLITLVKIHLRDILICMCRVSESGGRCGTAEKSSVSKRNLTGQDLCICVDRQ